MHSVGLSCSFPSALLKSRHIWSPANDSRPRAPCFPSSLPKTPVQTPFPASWNENDVKRPTLLQCRQRQKNKNSKVSQEAAGSSGKTAAKTPPLGREGWSSGIPVELHSCLKARQPCPAPYPHLPENKTEAPTAEANGPQSSPLNPKSPPGV